MPETTTPPAPAQAQPASAGGIQLTPELVMKIAARVYAMMLAELKLERERRRCSPQSLRSINGGRYGA